MLTSHSSCNVYSPVHDQGPHSMYMPPPAAKPEGIDSPRSFPGFVAMPSQPTTPRPGGSPPGSGPHSPHEDRKMGSPLDGRGAPFTTSSFHSAPFQSGVQRKRRADSLFPVEAGPFFSATKPHHSLYTMDRTNGYKLRINSKVDRGFFLADNDWTCYRRNYFQVSSAFSIQGTNHGLNDVETPCLIEVDGAFHTVQQFLLGISAKVSNSDKKIELVQHTPKRDKGPQMVPQAKAIRAGGNLNLSSVGSNQNIVTFERVQFKTATANNGKRRAAQQYYVIIVDLYVQCDNGEQYKVASSQSAPLVVRGRSPGHYADNHERFNPLAMGPAPPEDRMFAGFSHRTPGGPPPGVMPGDFNASYSPYSPYPPYSAFSPNPPLRSDPLSMLMQNSPSAPNPPYHPHHPPQPYMVPSISDVSSSESSSPDMYTNELSSPDPNDNNHGPNHHTPKLAHVPQSHPHHQPMGLNIQGVSTEGGDPWNRTRANSSTSVISYSASSSHSTEEPQYPPYPNGSASQNGQHQPPTSSGGHSAFTTFDSRQPPNGQQGHPKYHNMKLEINGQHDLPAISEHHPMTSPAYHSHEYEDFQWHQQHNHQNGYHSEGDHPGYHHHPNGGPGSNGRPHPNGHQAQHHDQNGRSHQQQPPPHMTNGKPANGPPPSSQGAPNGHQPSSWDNGNRHDNPATSGPGPLNGHTSPSTPTTELGKTMMNMSFRMGKMEEADKL
ncbi:hypothetical protein BC938DRAFT_483078 [Jimgerdemannia flammicorona]|uniref:NDT80 domain-containing protein n=1 Tax=Jimgerdemannia flammicorona TaxID=994334 RepID=A0A433QCU0_9FUNG|nr:hypothetical protein BC938DRAFT_483078 [Jimgerdemannia flammicorona]